MYNKIELKILHQTIELAKNIENTVCKLQDANYSLDCRGDSKKSEYLKLIRKTALSLQHEIYNDIQWMKKR